jgi:hypothetical protein
VKKIISILLALGVVLSLTVMATPVAADVTEPEVDVDNPCACEVSAYNITFNITASLTEGVGCVCVEFPAGTTVPSSFKDGEIVINGENVFADEITVDGTTVCFVPPAHIDDPGPVWVYFSEDADIKNPCVAADDYTLFVWTCRAPDSTPVESEEYEIIPQVSEYGFVVDFGDTYPGIAVDFVPPFKACGQNSTDADFYTAYNDTLDIWYDYFVLNFTALVEGCSAPCDSVDIWFEVVACPADEVIRLSLNSTWYVLDDDNITEEVGVYDSADDFLLADDAALDVDTEISWDGLLHFSSPGTYELCFYAECPEVTPECPLCEEADPMIAERCLVFEVHQWKDAAKITIDEKWNLLSLPLVPFDSDIDNILASLPEEAMDDLVSIWYYDRCSETWYVYDGNEYEELTDIEDGNAYWFRMDYPLDVTYSWWVWGTEMPEPEASPAEYAVCEGWNMVGFTSLTDYDAFGAVGYLWNWTTPAPVVYGWTQGDWNSQGWVLIGAADDLVSTQGYWMAFPADGAIYVPTP